MAVHRSGLDAQRVVIATGAVATLAGLGVGISGAVSGFVFDQRARGASARGARAVAQSLTRDAHIGAQVGAGGALLACAGLGACLVGLVALR
jgi:hypothetical protein